METKDESWREAIVQLVLQVPYIFSPSLKLSWWFLFQSVELRKRPVVEIPIAGPDHFVRAKKAVKPDRPEAISKHQTRMLRNANL